MGICFAFRDATNRNPLHLSTVLCGLVWVWNGECNALRPYRRYGNVSRCDQDNPLLNEW